MMSQCGRVLLSSLIRCAVVVGLAYDERWLPDLAESGRRVMSSNHVERLRPISRRPAARDEPIPDRSMPAPFRVFTYVAGRAQKQGSPCFHQQNEACFCVLQLGGQYSQSGRAENDEEKIEVV